ncbi:MAG: carbon-nitrogen family hydrolase [Planctomycetes bacterium]|nr:carbon-nitrogen family hydrolase [Planctomycetota bacterium]
MRLHLVQLDIRWEDAEANCRRVAELLDAAHPDPGDLVILPEMFDTGFSFNTAATVDQGRTLAFLMLQATSRQVYMHGHRTASASGNSTEAAARNRATAISPDGTILAEYDKIHLFSIGGESQRLSSGTHTTTYQIADAGATFNVFPAICYDLRFPELFRGPRIGTLDLIAIGACWPAKRAAHFRALSIARAIENQSFMAFCNRTGNDPAPTNTTYSGGSLVIDPLGNVLAEADEREQVLSVSIDLTAARNWREQFPAWRDAKH